MQVRSDDCFVSTQLPGLSAWEVFPFQFGRVNHRFLTLGNIRRQGDNFTIFWSSLCWENLVYKAYDIFAS